MKYYYTNTERKKIEFVAQKLKLQFDFDNCKIYAERIYGAQSFATYSYNDLKIRRISKGNFYRIGSKEFYCKTECYLFEEQFYIIKNSELITVKQKEIFE
ncbi:MAG: hypothetical protein LBN27_02085 [Prevotellaceae bacterium]|jgi:hypothetical protein|nr:hypothetical protein [Prevotellaceae bacterium]